MDDKDRKIIGILKEHADYTTRQIAKKTLLPRTTVHNRIKKLKEDGVIRKFTVQLDNSKIGKGLVAYVLISANIGALKQKHKTQYDIVNDLKKLEFVERADIVSGGTDIVATIRVKDVAEFDKVLLNNLQLIDGVEKTQTMIVLEEVE